MKVYATNPPSMTVLIDTGSEELPFDIEQADTMTDRVDLIYAQDKRIRAIKGQPIMIEGAPPPDPELEPGQKVIAQILVPAAATFIADAHITNFDDTPTGQMPVIKIHADAARGIQMAFNGGREPGISVTLDSEDEFDALLIPLVMLQRKKRADYANDQDIYANFRANAAALDLPGYTALQDCLSMVTRKVGRIVNLRGKEPNNESVVDSYMDLAVYSILAYGLALEAAEEFKPKGALAAGPAPDEAQTELIENLK